MVKYLTVLQAIRHYRCVETHGVEWYTFNSLCVELLSVPVVPADFLIAIWKLYRFLKYSTELVLKHQIGLMIVFQIYFTIVLKENIFVHKFYFLQVHNIYVTDIIDVLKLTVPNVTRLTRFLESY